jgi:hypothetical protein
MSATPSPGPAGADKVPLSLNCGGLQVICDAGLGTGASDGGRLRYYGASIREASS